MYVYLSYHRCYIWLKSACRVYYSYLRQAIHDIVTSQINIPKMQMAAIFLSIQKFDWWITLSCCINVVNNSCCVIKGITRSQLSVYRLFRMFIVSFYLYRQNESRLPLQQNKKHGQLYILPFHLCRRFKTHNGTLPLLHALLVA